MEELKLLPGQVYHLKVTEFRPKNKTITKQDQKQYELFFVKVQDDSGKSVLCEFACLEGTCKQDTFVVGVKQYIRCGFLSQRGTPEIEPSEEPVKGVQKGPNPGTESEVLNSYAVSVMGKSFTFAMGFAKDILCAEIGQQEFGTKVTDEHIDRMIGWAERISNAMTERITF
jgi:hypothetical protein